MPDVDASAHEVLTSTSVWSCAVVVAKYLERTQGQAHGDADGGAGHGSGRGGHKVPRLTGSTRVIELGAGTGVAGVAAAALVRRNDPAAGPDAVLLTDVAAAVPGLRHTILLNSASATDGGGGGGGDGGGAGAAGTQGRPLPIRAGALDWTRCEDDLRALGVAHTAFDVVVAADVVWVAHLIAPFVRTLRRVTAPGSVVVFGYQSRSSAADRELFGLLGADFDVVEVPDADLDPVFRAPGTVAVYLLVRRSLAEGKAATDEPKEDL